MDPARFTQLDRTTWRIEPHGAMRVPAIIFADEGLIRDIDDKVYEQAANVATLPGIVRASYAMPDAHWGYGFPIGGVAAFDPDKGGVVSAGGVGFDISCGVRTMLDRPRHRRHSSRAEIAGRLPLPADSGRPRQQGSHNARCRCHGRHAGGRSPTGRSIRAGARRVISSGSKRAAKWPGRSPAGSRNAPRSASAGKWARSVPAITISRCRPSPKSMTLPSRRRSASRKTTWW